MMMVYRYEKESCRRKFCNAIKAGLKHMYRVIKKKKKGGHENLCRSVSWPVEIDGTEPVGVCCLCCKPAMLTDQADKPSCQVDIMHHQQLFSCCIHFFFFCCNFTSRVWCSFSTRLQRIVENILLSTGLEFGTCP